MASLMYRWFLVCGFWMLNGGWNTSTHERMPPHPIYIAVTEINQNAQDKTLEVSCKMFAEDLELIIDKKNNTSLDITTEKDKGSFDKYIPAYVNQHLAVSVDGKPLALKYVGFERSEEYVFCYFEIPALSAPKKIDITNSILHDFNQSQINIVHVTINGKRQSTKLNYPDKEVSFSF